ncbi:MAG: hypothetical protein SPL42_04570 [Bacteroidales bacterium]|nr:hypothetical protein [Bacteroidales bacterium]MDY6347690.1 hypothetical protein [Bacteroidales bacterium]
MEIGNFGYYWLDTWVMSNVIQLATQDFCRRYLNRTNDPFGTGQHRRRQLTARHLKRDRDAAHRY